MNKKTKIIITTLSVSTMTIVPCITTISVIRNKKFNNNTQYFFLDKNFSTKKEAFDYANAITKSFEHKTKTPTKWSLKRNNELKTFNNQKDILNYLDEFIEKKPYTSYTDNHKTDAIKALLPSEISKMNFNSNITTKTIYRGKNNSIHLSKEEAKKSYFQMHEVYYFDGVFFRTKEELAIWLEKNITNYGSNNNSSIYEILFQDIDGNFSTPLKIDELKKDFDNNKIPTSLEHFVKTNNKSYFKYNNKDLNKTIFVSERNLDEISKYYNSKYTQITSNQGKGNYIIDTSIDDEANLIGPYYIKSGTEIKQITDRTKWRKIEGTDYNIVDEIKEKSIISNFMNLLLANPYSKPTRSIDTFFSIKDIQEEIDNYFTLLSNELPQVYESLNNLYQTMKQGKRYGEFLKVPIFLVHTLDQMIYYNVSQEYIDKTRQIYSLICDYYDEQLYSMVPEKFLLKKNNDKFSFKKIFGVNNQNLDLNYDIDTLIGEVIYEFPNLLEFASFISYFEMNLSKLNTLEGIEFSPDYFLKTYKLKLNPKLFNEYKIVWDTLSSSNFEDLYKNINKINNNIDPSKAYYYINNFILQQKSNDISKVIISFWLDKNKAIEEFNLTQKEIEYLHELIKNTSYNSLFNIQTTGLFFNDNFEFLKKLYYKKNSVDPILFSRLIMYMQYFKNQRKLSTLIENIISENNAIRQLAKNFKDDFEYIVLKNATTNFVQSTILKDSFFISSNNIVSSFSRTNINSISISRKKIEMIIIKPDNKAKKFMDAATNIYGGVTSIFNLISDKIQNGFSGAWDAAKFVLSIYKEIFSMLTLACPWFAIGSILCDFIINFYKQETFSYIFESEDAKFIWNGGMQETWFYGLIPGNSTTIEDMKLLDPIEVIKPNNTQGFYYNGNIFGDVNSLTMNQLNDILNNRYSNNDLEKVYSLIDLEKQENNNAKFYDKSIDTLLINFSKHVNNVIVNNIYDNDPIIKKSSYKFGSFIYDNNLTKKDNIEKVLSNIKPSLVAQLPILNSKDSKYSRIPIFNDSIIGDDNSVLPYKLPGKSWTANGGLQINEDQNYIIVDQNPIDQSVDVNYENKLETNFMNSFDVLSKEVDAQFINSTNLYSELSTKIISNYCYIAKGKDNKTNIFLTKNDAINWLLSEFDYQAYFVDESVETFLINNKIFNSYKQYINWVNNNIKEIK